MLTGNESQAAILVDRKTPRLCAHCHKLFTPEKYPHQKYCGPRCRDLFWCAVRADAAERVRQQGAA